MRFFTMFKSSARELKNPRCLAVTGVLIAVFIVLKAYFSIRMGTTLRISLAFIPLAAIGMLYGPVVCALAAIPCDILGALLAGSGVILPAFTFILMFNGLVYGIFLYGFEQKPSFIQSVKVITAQALVVFVGHLLFNTLALEHYGFIGGDESTMAVLITARIVKSLIEYPINLFLLFLLLPIIKMIYTKAIHGHSDGHSERGAT